MNHIAAIIDAMNADQERRYAWLFDPQIRRWREEDHRNGIEWETSTGTSGQPNKRAGEINGRG